MIIVYLSFSFLLFYFSSFYFFTFLLFYFLMRSTLFFIAFNSSTILL